MGWRWAGVDVRGLDSTRSQADEDRSRVSRHGRLWTSVDRAVGGCGATRTSSGYVESNIVQSRSPLQTIIYTMNLLVRSPYISSLVTSTYWWLIPGLRLYNKSHAILSIKRTDLQPCWRLLEDTGWWVIGGHSDCRGLCLKNTWMLQLVFSPAGSVQKLKPLLQTSSMVFWWMLSVLMTLGEQKLQSRAVEPPQLTYVLEDPTD